jgi:hypothetical protein
MQLLLGDTLPVFDSEYFLWLVSRILHIASAAILVGGLFYLRVVVAPQVARSSSDSESVFGSRRRSWALVVMATTLLLLLSGFYNLFFVILWPNEKLPPLYHMLFGLKFLLALALFFVAAALAGRSGLGARLRGSLGRWLDLAIVAALAIVVLAAVMRTIPKIPKVADNLVATTHDSE